MLSKKDKDWIKEAIKESVKEALTIEWTIQKMRDDKTGQPLAVPETITEEVFMPSAFLQLLPFHEGALRGMQHDMNKNNVKVDDLSKKVELVGNVLIQTENSLKCIAAVTDKINQLEVDSVTNIKYIEGSTDGESDN